MYTIGTLLYFRRALDSIKHVVLLGKLYRYAVRDSAFVLVGSYLCERYTATKFLSCATGIYPGSPFVFIIHINNISHIPQTHDTVLYADDTNLLFPDITTIENTCKNGLSVLLNWLSANWSWTPVKPSLLFLRQKNKKTQEISPMFGTSVIERVSRFLGVQFHENLNWSCHIDKIRPEISRFIGIMNKFEELMPAWLKCLLYFSLSQFRINYCLTVWGTASKTSSSKI